MGCIVLTVYFIFASDFSTEFSLTRTFTYAYVTYHDIRSIKSFEDQTVIAIKAPPETKLEVPDPSEVSLHLTV